MVVLVPEWRVHSVHIPANATSGRLSSIANHLGVFFGLVSAYSQNDDIGTRHRLSGASHRRQGGDPVLRMLVVMPGCCGGFGGPPPRLGRLPLPCVSPHTPPAPLAGHAP